MIVCLKCQSISYSKSMRQIKEDGIRCECGSKFVEVDELIAPAVFELNRKGYTTQFCCSGHLYEGCLPPTTYIMFEDYYNDGFNKPLPSVPEGFILESGPRLSDDWYCDVIRAGYCEDDDITEESLKYNITEIARLNRVLYEWALSLPNKYE